MRKRTAFDWACLVFIILFLCITVFPFVWIIITSFKTDADIHGRHIRQETFRIPLPNP